MGFIMKILVIFQYGVCSSILGHSFSVVESAYGKIGPFVEGIFDSRLILKKPGEDDVAVDELGTILLDGRHAPHEQTSLDQIIKRKPTENQIGKIFTHRKETIHNPVGQPLCVII